MATGSEDGLMDREKTALVQGMVRLLGATVNLTTSYSPARNSEQGTMGDLITDTSGGSSSEDDTADHCTVSAHSDSLTPTVGEGKGGEQCAVSGSPGWITEWDRRELAAADGEFIQVADIRAAAAFSAHNRHTECTKVSHILKAASAAATRLRDRVVKLHRWGLKGGGAASGHAMAMWEKGVGLLPPLVVQKVGNAVRTLGEKFGRGGVEEVPVTEEWWKIDPLERPSLLTLAGWRSRTSSAWELVPAWRDVVLTCSRLVPGVDAVLLRIIRTAPVCISTPVMEMLEG